MRRNQRRPANSKRKTRGVTPRSVKYESPTTRQKKAYDLTTNLIADLRQSKGSYAQLLRKHHLSSRSARKYGGRDLLGGTRGKPMHAGKGDRRVRDLWFPGPSGDVRFRTRSSRDATQISDYYNDREKLLGNKMSAKEFEVKWQGVQVDGQDLLADADQIFRMEDAGVLKLENLYASVESPE